MKKENFRIVFMGTPEFAVASLDALLKENFNIAAVVTAPDKPAGRGQKILVSPVKKYALTCGLEIMQPEKLKDPGFLDKLNRLEPQLQVVVAFRMLPEAVWRMPRYGSINLHASLLPQYRGAAPVNWAIINGEKQTGVTTFFIQKEIDTGNIILQEKVPVGEKETAGELHDRLMIIGANLIVRTVYSILESNYTETYQTLFPCGKTDLHTAPKISREDCRINWNNDVTRIFNFIRGLSPSPGAWSEWPGRSVEKLILKIYRSEKEIVTHHHIPGALIRQENMLKVACDDGYILIRDLQQAGKKRMGVEEFLRGIRDLDQYLADRH